MANILLVEDDPAFARLTSTFLARQGHDVEVNPGTGVVRRVLSNPPELLILDLELPEESGLSICRKLREGQESDKGYKGPILMLTGRTADMDELMGWEMGVDDYVRKPCDPRVLNFRVNALLRRGVPEVAETDSYTDTHLEISLSKRQVRVNGSEATLTSGEFELLWYMVERVGTPVAREDYFQDIRGIAYDGQDRTFDARMSQLRRKLSKVGLPKSRLSTVRGVGYQLNRA